MAKKTPEILAAIRLWKKGWKDLEEKIAALVAKYTKGEKQLESQIVRAALSGRMDQRKYRRDQIFEAHEVLRRVERQTRAPTNRVVRDAYRLGARVGQRSQVFGEGSTFGRVNREAVDLLVRNLEGRLSDSTTTVGRRIDDVFRREGLRVAAAQLLDERGLVAARAELAQRLQDEGVTAFQDRAGRRWGLEQYAEMAIRTVTAEAAVHGTAATLLDRGFDIIDINTVQDPCPICKPFDGNTYSLTGRSTEFEHLVRLPPWHPRCRHFITASVHAIEDRRKHGIPEPT